MVGAFIAARPRAFIVSEGWNERIAQRGSPRNPPLETPNNRFLRLLSNIGFEKKKQHADAYGRNSDSCAETAGTLCETEGSPLVLRKSAHTAVLFISSSCSVLVMCRLSFSSVCMITGTLPTEIFFPGKNRFVILLSILWFSCLQRVESA